MSRPHLFFFLLATDSAQASDCYPGPCMDDPRPSMNGPRRTMDDPGPSKDDPGTYLVDLEKTSSLQRRWRPALRTLSESDPKIAGP